MPSLLKYKIRISFHIALIGTMACAFLFSPMIGPIILGAWFADLLYPLIRFLTRVLGNRIRAAALVTALACVAIFVPLLGTGAILLTSIKNLIPRAQTAIAQGSFQALLESDLILSEKSWLELAREHTTELWKATTLVMGASTNIGLTIFILMVSVYGFATIEGNGEEWLKKHIPIPYEIVTRLIHAFRETGRGLVIGTGLTAAAQGLVAIIGYIALGIPQPILFGILTGLASLIPVVGTALVWAPFAIRFATTGQVGHALILTAFGLGVIGLIDNILRPALTRYGKLDLSYAVLLLSMLIGGLLLGFWGVLLGPLIVRLTIEALRIACEYREQSELEGK